MVLLALVACSIDNGVVGKPDDPAPFDSGEDRDTDQGEDSAPPPEECNGVDDDGDGLVDEDHPDTDGDGVADCVDDACEVEPRAAGTVPLNDACGSGGGWTPPADLGDAVKEWSVTGPNALNTPIVAQVTDDDGDGDIDADDVPDVLVVDYGTAELLAYSGDTGARHWTRSLGVNPMGIAVADVDGDGTPNLVRQGANGLCVDEPDGTNLWCNNAVDQTYNGGPTITDLEGDGWVEIIASRHIVDGATGATRASGVCTRGATFPVVGDLDGDGVKEIVCGASAYTADGRELWNIGYGAYDYAALVDVDADDTPEVLVTGWGTGIALYAADGTLLATTGTGGTYSAACVADLDGDGAAEIAVPASRALEAYELDLTKMWSIPATDTSGASSCAAFDLDADGAYEVLYADEEVFGIYDGATGAARFTWADHTSGTMWEYPVVADIDLDGAAEIVVAESYFGNTGLMVFGHADGDWPPVGPTWSQYAFDGGNVSDDGEVLADPPPPWRDGGFIHARPPGYLDPSTNTWEIGLTRPDLSVSIDDVCAADCTDGPVEVALSAANAGSAAAEAVVVLYAVEADGEREVGRATLTLEPGTRGEPIVLSLTPADVGLYGWAARVSRADGGADCDPADDEDRWIEVPCG